MAPRLNDTAALSRTPCEHVTDAALPISLGNRGIPWRWIALGLVSTLIVLIVLLMRAGLAVEPFTISALLVYLCGTLALAARIFLPHSNWRHARVVSDCAEYYGLFTCIALMGAIACYPISALTHGFSDAKLQALDELMHFNWPAWYEAVADSKILQGLGTAAYRSIFITPAVLLAYFAINAQRAEAHRFLFTFWLSAVVTLTLFKFMPAVGPLSYLWRGEITYMPESELWQPDLIPLLRAQTVHWINIGELRGLVSAPSFHAAAATLYAAAAWRVPKLRWPLLAVNAAMLLSTPVEGTHYLSDIILGMMVAGAALMVVHYAVKWLDRRGEKSAPAAISPATAVA